MKRLNFTLGKNTSFISFIYRVKITLFQLEGATASRFGL